MVSKKLKSDHQVLEKFLVNHADTDNSHRQLERKPDDRFGLMYAFDYTPCCIPLHSLAWINPVTPGVFFRCFFPALKNKSARNRVYACINPINYSLPAGSFVISPDHEVFFKNAVYFENLPLTEELLNGLFAPSFEFIDIHWEAILKAILGKDAPPHRY